LAPFVKLAPTITDQRAGILAAIQHGLSNARVEAINTQLRLITRRAFSFHTPDALIALAMLTLADLCPSLPPLTRPTETTGDSKMGVLTRTVGRSASAHRYSGGAARQRSAADRARRITRARPHAAYQVASARVGVRRGGLSLS
jgi:Transposase